MVLPAVGRWEDKGTSTAELAASIVGDGPTVVVEDEEVVQLVECEPAGTSMEHP
jgi:hypothetical protein